MKVRQVEANLRDLLSLFYIESFRKNTLSQVYCCVANIWNTLNFYEKVKMFLKLWLKCSIPVQISNPNQARYNLKMSSPSWVCFNLTPWRLKNNIILNGKFISRFILLHIVAEKRMYGSAQCSAVKNINHSNSFLKCVL